jgi:hypothetical protein
LESDLNANEKIITSPLDPTDDAHVGDRGYNDGRYLAVGDVYTDAEAVTAVESANPLVLDGRLDAVQIHRVDGGAGSIGEDGVGAFLNGYFTGEVYGLKGFFSERCHSTRYYSDSANAYFGISGGALLELSAAGFFPFGAGSSLDVGTPSRPWQDGNFSGTVNLAGISFGTDTMADYDVVDFTPGVTFGGGSTGIAYTTQEARAVKVGPKVHIWGRIVLSNKGSSTGAAAFTGMPYTCANTHKATGGNAVNFTVGMSAITHPLVTKMSPGNTQFGFNMASGNNLTGAVTNSNFSNTSSVYFDFSYYTDS